jgi:hypothetical protein
MTGVARKQQMVSLNAASAVISRIITSNDAYAALGAYAHADASMQPALEKIALASARLRLIMASAPFAPPSLLDRLAQAADLQLALRLAKNPSTPPEGLRRLLRGARPSLCGASSPRIHRPTLQSCPGCRRTGRSGSGAPCRGTPKRRPP